MGITADGVDAGFILRRGDQELLVGLWGGEVGEGGGGGGGGIYLYTYIKYFWPIYPLYALLVVLLICNDRIVVGVNVQGSTTPENTEKHSSRHLYQCTKKPKGKRRRI